MPRTVEGHLSAEGLDFSIIVSRFNDFITMRLLDGALDALLRHGARDEQLTVYRVPGAFEIPMMAKKIIDLGQAGDAMICLGALSRVHASLIICGGGWQASPALFWRDQ
jgi:6,7-dimethyl-8-ribityllumazine synthase